MEEQFKKKNNTHLISVQPVVNLSSQLNEKDVIITKTSPNLLINSTWNFNSFGWLSSFNTNRKIILPEIDKPDSNILQFPIGRKVTKHLSQPSDAVFIEANQLYTLDFDIKLDGIKLFDIRVLSIRLFESESVGADAIHAIREIYLVNNKPSVATDLNLEIEEYQKWYRVKVTFEFASEGWVRILPYSNDASSVLGMSYRELMLTKGITDVSWSPSVKDEFEFLHASDGLASVENLKNAESNQIEPIIKLVDIVKSYNLYDKKAQLLKDMLVFKKRSVEKFYAIKSLSVEIFPGESVGLVGVNGSGKSTLAGIISGLVPLTSGLVNTSGDILMVSISSGMRFELTGLENIRLKLVMHGFKDQQINALIDDIVIFSELGKQIDQKIKHYSSGMRARLGFSIMVHMDADIMIVDEALAVGDSAFKEKCENRMQLFKNQGKSFIIVSHNIGDIKRLCEKTIWLDNGNLVQFGDTTDILSNYHHYVNWFKNLNPIYRNEITNLKRNERITLQNFSPSKNQDFEDNFYFSIVDLMLLVSLILLISIIIFAEVRDVLIFWQNNLSTRN